MQAHLEPIEIEPARRGDDDLAVDDTAVRQGVEHSVVQLRKVPIERLEVAALDEHVAPAAKDERAKAVPLGLEEKLVAARDLVRDFREHGLDRRGDGKGRHGS